MSQFLGATSRKEAAVIRVRGSFVTLSPAVLPLQILAKSVMTIGHAQRCCTYVSYYSVHVYFILLKLSAHRRLGPQKGPTVLCSLRCPFATWTPTSSERELQRTITQQKGQRGPLLTLTHAVELTFPGSYCGHCLHRHVSNHFHHHALFRTLETPKEQVFNIEGSINNLCCNITSMIEDYKVVRVQPAFMESSLAT